MMRDVCKVRVVALEHADDRVSDRTGDTQWARVEVQRADVLVA
jgi:hypothetical protein